MLAIVAQIQMRSSEVFLSRKFWFLGERMSEIKFYLIVGISSYPSMSTTVT